MFAFWSLAFLCDISAVCIHAFDCHSYYSSMRCPMEQLPNSVAERSAVKDSNKTV